MTTTQQITSESYSQALASRLQTFTERDGDTGQIIGVYTVDEGRKVYVARWAVQ